MMKAVEVARDRRIPFFGICYGFQWATVEYARNVCGILNADSTEVAPDTDSKVIYKLRDLLGVDDLGGTMRLGSYACQLKPGSLSHRLYGSDVIHERHRHRYEFNCLFEPAITEKGLEIVGRSLDGKFVEIVELPSHPWFIAVQFHPEVQVQAAEAAPAVCRLRRSDVQARPCLSRGRQHARRDHGVAAGGPYNGAVQPVQAGPVTFGAGRLALIAGPCVIESEGHALDLGHAIAAMARTAGVPYVFKASFDKANRTSLSSFRGPGLDAGLRTLARVKAEVGVPVLTDIHEPAQAAPAADVVDVLQIPAFLCRQTDLLVAAARTGAVVNIKKGQFLAPAEMRYALDKVRDSGHDRVLLTERGTSFGYHNLVVDMRAFPQLRALGAPVVYDVTHSLQLPGAGEGAQRRSGGIHRNDGLRRCRRRRRWRLPGSARRPDARQIGRGEQPATRPAACAARATDPCS